MGGVAALLLLPGFAFAFDAAISSGEVPRNVSAAGIELGGLGKQDALAALQRYEAQLAAIPAVFTVKGEKFTLDPSEVGFNIDEEAVVDEALGLRSDIGFPSGLFKWFGTFRNEINLEVPATIDPARLDEVLTTWEQEAIASPAFEGGLIVRNGRVLPEYPRPGEGINREAAATAILATLQDPARTSAVIATRQIQPQLTKDYIDNASAEATRLIDAKVTLTSSDPTLEISFTPRQLADALIADVRRQSPPELVLEFDPSKIAALLEPMRAEIEQPPRDAGIVIDEETKEVSLSPSRRATLLDPNLVAKALLEAAARPSNTGEFPFAFGEDAQFTTADAVALGDIQFVSEFTTKHSAGQQRVHNIQRFADIVDGAIVMPGDEFSLNEYVGERTTEKGFVPAPMILGGELVDSVGGGVSQFATTFYNAVFYGCYEDVTHKPHSYYFSRYPEVNEATISWPQPNLIFRNNTDTAVIIKTQYTATSITVQFYGNNGGCSVERVLGKRHGFTDPPEVFQPNPEINPDEQHVTQKGFGGFTNSVKRIATWPDGRTEEQEWTWTYRPEPRIIEVHPCMVPDAEVAVECPIQVPSLSGMDFATANSTLGAAGLVVAQGDTVEVSDASQNDLVVAQSPESGSWIETGSTVTINLGVYLPPPDGG